VSAPRSRRERVIATTLAIAALAGGIYLACTYEPPPPPPLPTDDFIPEGSRIIVKRGAGWDPLEEASGPSLDLLLVAMGLAALSLLATAVALAMKDFDTALACSLPPMFVGAGVLGVVLLDAADSNPQLVAVFPIGSIILLVGGVGMRRWATNSRSRDRSREWKDARQDRG
jgi:hypothetical protein